jgi:hypothetical protein
MTPSAPSSFDRDVEQVEDMMEQGTAFARVEDAINAAPLSQDHKAALWLFAWSLRDPGHQRHDARLTLGLVGPAAV